jgi:transcriptional regulator with PAS, ATPase and Fis domain
MGMAQELLEVQPVNGFHRDVESQSRIPLNGADPDYPHAPAQLARPEAFSRIVSVSRVMNELIDKVARVSTVKVPMLITGETGTGKELLARAVHDASDRRNRQFIPFNCATASRELIESRLFGHQRGSFTGADRNVKGVIREAGGGTLLLDEVGELSLELQPLLLRFLQEGEVHPMGAPKPIKTDVRVIAATNRDPEADVRSGRFRADLYHRLNVFRVHIPPLRDRREDIRPLVEHFLAQRQREIGEQGQRLSDEAWKLMLDYHWPGNAREVENWSHRLAASAVNSEVIGREIALAALRTGICAPPPAAVVIKGNGMIDLDMPLHKAKDKLERLLIERALKVTGGNRIQAATRLKIYRDGLRKMIDRLKIKVDRDDRRK